MITRQTFEGLTHWEIVVWYVLVATSLGAFSWGVARLAAKYAMGGRQTNIAALRDRIVQTCYVVLSHRSIRRRDTVAGIAHALVFYGFVLLFLGSLVLGFQDDFTKPVFSFTFWHDWFYRIYSFVLDVAGVALVTGVAIMAVKRGLTRPLRLDYSRPDRTEDRRRYVVGDWIFLVALFALGMSGFFLESLRLVESRPQFETWSPVGWAGGEGLRAVGMDINAAASAHFVVWWVHGVAALTFVAAIPFTKAVHMIMSPTNMAIRDRRAGKVLPTPVTDGTAGRVGYTTITDLTRQHLLSLDACTKCGKCHDACPARQSGYPLSPRDVILDLREMAEGALGIRASLGVRPIYSEGRPIVDGNGIGADTIWSCMQCMACVEICPVGIEHVPIINELRRGLIDRGEMDGMLQTTLEAVYQSGNSFGLPQRRRPRWADALEFEVKDARNEPVDLLWFVGDYASYDPRNQRNTHALAEVLYRARVDFGILFEAEKTAGCDVRRAGEEGLWTLLADENIAVLAECKFNRIFSADPHTFHTLRNEYPERGGRWTVVHHSEVLLELLNEGVLVPERKLNYRVTYHDPCTLGRYNGVYEAPRDILRAIGCDVIEMPRNRDNSLCCGAGGGRIWMKEMRADGAQRPSEQRIDEAVELGGIEYFVVACPKDVTMYTDAIKTSGHENDLELRELSELVLEALAVGDGEEHKLGRKNAAA